MKRSASTAELFSEREESSDAVESTHADLGLESYGVQGQRDVGEGSAQAASGASPPSMQASAWLEFLDIELGITQGTSGVAVQPTQAGLGLDSHSSQDQPDGGEVVNQADSGVAVQLTQAHSRIESQNFQEQPNVEGAFQPICNGVIQPMQANLRHEPQNLQEQPSVEGREVHEVQPAQEALPNVPSLDVFNNWMTLAQDDTVLAFGLQGEASNQGEEAGNDRIVPQDPPSSMNNIGHEPQSLQEQPSVEGREAHEVQGAEIPLPDPFLEHISVEDLAFIMRPAANAEEHEIAQQILRRIFLDEASDQGEEAGINDRVAPQDSPSDMNNLGNSQVEISHQEEEAGINDRIVPPAPPVDMDNFGSDGLDEPVDDEEDTGVQARGVQQQMQNGPPQQGTAGRRLRLQMRLCGAEWRSEPKCESIASSQPSDFLCKDAICSSARMTLKEEGDMVGLLSTEGLIARATESDDADGSSTPALVFTCLFRSFCKLTRMAFTYV